ncbi:hypothetical protein HY439_03415 [Candidatus Microgenomates bacterium]|nr:hypothetical protein [Candidatus Microgenomates bacterium]
MERQEKAIPASVKLGAEIDLLDREVATTKRGLRPKDRLDQIHLDKASRIIRALELRGNGDHSIGVTIVLSGDPQDELHDYSQAQVLITFKRINYTTRTHLKALRANYEGNMLMLIGKPDRTQAEEPHFRARRLISEINEIQAAISVTIENGDVRKEMSLERLKAKQAEKVFKLMVSDRVKKGRFDLIYFGNPGMRSSDDTLAMYYEYMGKKAGFDVSARHLFMRPGLEKLMRGIRYNKVVSTLRSRQAAGGR